MFSKLSSPNQVVVGDVAPSVSALLWFVFQTPLGGIHLHETKKKYLDGCLHPANVLMCPHTCVVNLPKPREHHPGTYTVSLRAHARLRARVVFMRVRVT